MAKLIILRGNSGSGKTTIAKELQKSLGRNTMFISQDVIRRDMLRVKDGENTECKVLHRKIIQLFFELLERSNPEVQALANQMIKCAAYSIDAAVRELHFSGKKIPVYLSGSILTKAASSGYLSMLKKALSCICQGKLEVHMCTKRPVEGAVQLLKG